MATLAPPADTAPPPAAAEPAVDDQRNHRTFALHKPRGYLSVRLPHGKVCDELGRPSAYNLVPPGCSAVGRLDMDTSGLLIFTSDPRVHKCILSGDMEKVYVATVGGTGAIAQDALTSLQEPMAITRIRWKKRAEGAPAPEPAPQRFTKPGQARVLRSWRLGESSDMDERAEMVWRRSRREKGGISLQEEAHSEDGWLTEVEVRINQGKFHQVRQLVQRARLRMRHLERVGIGEINLDGIPNPGDVRQLGATEVASILTVAAVAAGAAATVTSRTPADADDALVCSSAGCGRCDNAVAAP
mmetsp:Transcript_15671/g.47921  ORF Transcript_15671/g.47921 Transcript_15671/m.47921 type:complete len:300 (-) Transcript_15671:371-1270(-)